MPPPHHSPSSRCSSAASPQVAGLALRVVAKAMWVGLATDLASYRRDYDCLPGPPGYPLLHRDLRLRLLSAHHDDVWDETEVCLACVIPGSAHPACGFLTAVCRLP